MKIHRTVHTRDEARALFGAGSWLGEDCPLPCQLVSSDQPPAMTLDAARTVLHEEVVRLRGVLFFGDRLHHALTIANAIETVLTALTDAEIDARAHELRGRPIAMPIPGPGR